jgi:hypothetical protein
VQTVRAAALCVQTQVGLCYRPGMVQVQPQDRTGSCVLAMMFVETQYGLSKHAH